MNTSIILPSLIALASSAPLYSAVVLAPSEDVMTSAFFQGADLVRGYSGDNRPTFRVSSDNAFGTGPETIYLSFSSFSAGDYSAPVQSATISLTSVAGGFGGDASSGNPFNVSAHGVDTNPFTAIADDTNAGGTIQWLDFYNNNILAAPTSATTAVDSFGLIEIDVTGLVNDWIAGTNSEFTIAITGKNDVQVGNGFLHGFLNNSEASGSTFLTINAVPEPSTALLSVLGILGGLARRSRK